MPIIKIHCFNSKTNIQRIDIEVEVWFSEEYYSTIKASEKLKEIQQDLNTVIKKYFPEEFLSDRWLSDHRYNTQQDADW